MSAEGGLIHCCVHFNDEIPKIFIKFSVIPGKFMAFHPWASLLGEFIHAIFDCLSYPPAASSTLSSAHRIPKYVLSFAGLAPKSTNISMPLIFQAVLHCLVKPIKLKMSFLLDGDGELSSTIHIAMLVGKCTALNWGWYLRFPLLYTCFSRDSNVLLLSSPYFQCVSQAMSPSAC
jgi:hypothetical protein